MAVTTDKPAPYAPATAVLEIIKRHRDRGLAGPVTPEVLARHGISDSLIPRTIQTLKALDLIDDEGRTTETFEGIRLAPEAQYTERLGQWLNSAYADVLQIVDPATATDTDLRDAFRFFKPIGLQPRMISLFTGLYGAAGIRAEKGNGTRTPKRTKPGPTGRPTAPLAPPKPAAVPSGVPSAGTPRKDDASDKALDYQLVDLLKHDDIADAERDAVWTLVQYLAKRKRPSATNTEGEK